MPTGYFIVDGQVKAFTGSEEEILKLAREDDSVPNQVFWTKEGAENELSYSTDPVGHTKKEYEAGDLSADEVRWRLGKLADKVLHG